MFACFCSERVCHFNVIVINDELKSIWMTSKYSVVFDKLPITVILHDIICTLMWVFDFMPNSGITQQSLKRVMHGRNMTKNTHFKSCLPLVQQINPLHIWGVLFPQASFHLAALSTSSLFPALQEFLFASYFILRSWYVWSNMECITYLTEIFRLLCSYSIDRYHYYILPLCSIIILF